MVFKMRHRHRRHVRLASVGNVPLDGGSLHEGH